MKTSLSTVSVTTSCCARASGSRVASRAICVSISPLTARASLMPHVHGRKGNGLGVVNVDGTGSHGTKMRLHPKDANALRARGVNIRADNIIEWLVLSGRNAKLLLG